jgi:mono/diheme cytochrome c family protein
MKSNPLLAGATLLFATGIAATLVTGCGPQRRDEPFTQRLQPDDPTVAAGQRLFSQHCYQCHPGGSAGLGPAINDKPLPVGLMKTQVRKGLGAMPAFSQAEISDDELVDVIRYLKALRTLKNPRASG